MFAWDQDYGERAPEAFHNGLDFSGYPGGSSGVAVVSIAAGRVVDMKVDDNKSTPLGNYIWVDHGSFQSRYCHMLAASHSHLGIGSNILQGAKVGNIGNSGYATTGAHLHLDIFVNGARIDPQAFIRSHLSSTPTPTPITGDEEMGRLVLHPNGSVAFASTDGTFTTLNSMDQVNALVATGACPAEMIKLSDGFIWDLRLQVASRRKTQNEL